jgi:hypothetical protein
MTIVTDGIITRDTRFPWLEAANTLLSVIKSSQELEMSETVEALILDLLEWVAKGERSYEEVMDAWRTSCPRLPVWEEANDRGFVMHDQANGRCLVRITSSGLAFLEQRRTSLRLRSTLTKA